MNGTIKKLFTAITCQYIFESGKWLKIASSLLSQNNSCLCTSILHQQVYNCYNIVHVWILDIYTYIDIIIIIINKHKSQYVW